MSHPSDLYPVSRCYHNLKRDGIKLRFIERFYIDMYTSSRSCLPMFTFQSLHCWEWVSSFTWTLREWNKVHGQFCGTLKSYILIHLVCASVWHYNSATKAFYGRSGLCIFYGRTSFCIILALQVVVAERHTLAIDRVCQSICLYLTLSYPGGRGIKMW
jgi:hypothetical protein